MAAKVSGTLRLPRAFLALCLIATLAGAADISADSSDSVDYHQAATHLDAAKTAKSPTARDEHLEAAQSALTSALGGNLSPTFARRARLQLVDVLQERSRLQMMLAIDDAAHLRRKHEDAARTLLYLADNALADFDRQADDGLKQIGVVRVNDFQKAETRDQIRRQQVQARLTRAWTQLELAQTFARGDSGRAAALAEAAKQFDALEQQQDKRLAGYYARLGRGLCWRELGDGQKAFAIFEQLLELPNEPADFQTLRGKAALQSLEIAVHPDMKKAKQGLDIAQHWLDADRLDGPRTEFDTAIRFLGAEAAIAYAGTLAKSSEQASRRSEVIEWARRQFTTVAASPSPYQVRAKVRLLDPIFGEVNPVQPGSFADARDRSQAAINRLAAIQAEQAPTDRDPPRQRRQQIATIRNEAIDYCRKALALNAPTVPADDFDLVRYHLVFLLYQSGEMSEAARVAEAMAQASSDSPSARRGAHIGLAACQSLLKDAPADGRAAAAKRVKKLADVIVARWSDRSEAVEARSVLLQMAIAAGNLDAAGQYLEKLPDTSPQRADAQLSLGQALCHRGLQIDSSNNATPSVAEADATIGRAVALLKEGIAYHRKSTSTNETSRTLTAAALALAQLHTASGHPLDAITWLEDPVIGPKSLLTATPPTKEQIDFAIQTYCVAFVAYVAGGQPEKARQCLPAIEGIVHPDETPETEEIARQEFHASLRLGRLLEQHFHRIRLQQKEDGLKESVRAFDEFLAPATSGPPLDDFFALTCKAEVYFGLAIGLDTGDPAVPVDAEHHYRRAADAYRLIGHRALTKRDFAPAQSLTAVRIRLARCLRRLGANREALAELLPVLKEHPGMIDAQVEAAYTFQARGDENVADLEIAIQGGSLFPTAWGWGEISRRVQSEPGYRNTYYEARYNLALCRLRQAQSATESLQVARLAATAENDILATQRLFPNLGGSVWYDRYNELMRQIQRLGNRPVIGLTIAPNEK